MPSRFKDKKPLQTFANASKSCAAPSLAYGKCVGKSYNDVSKGMCEPEFQAFKECVQKALGKKW